MKKYLIGLLLLTSFLLAGLAPEIYPTELSWEKTSFIVQAPLDWIYNKKDAKQNFMKFVVFPKNNTYQTTPVFFFADAEHKYIAGKQNLKAYMEKDRKSILNSQHDAKVKKIKNYPDLKKLKEKLSKTYPVKDIREAEADLPTYTYTYVRYIYIENSDAFHTIACFAKDKNVFEQHKELFYEFANGFDYLKK